MDKMEMVSEIMSLASGTLAMLFKEAKHAKIDEWQNEWVKWVESQPAEKHWATWQDCWTEFEGAVFR